MRNRLLLLWSLLVAVFLTIFLSMGEAVMAETLSDFSLPAAKVHAYNEAATPGRWYATSSSGTYLVSGHRVVMFDGVQLPQELAVRLVNLLAGAVWKEGYLLSHELLWQHVWPHLPGPLQTALKGASQLWLLLTLYRSLMDVAPPLATLLIEYHKAWSEPRYRGTLPIAVSDVELALRFFLQARFPDKLTDPVAVDIDRIPEMADLPELARPHDRHNPWNQLQAEMNAGDIERIQLAGSEEGVVELRYRDIQHHWREQVITTSVNSTYQPVPWLLEMVRSKTPREDIRLYASLLSQDVIDLAGCMLACRRQLTEQRVEEGPCQYGYLMRGSEGQTFLPDRPVAPPLIWENRNYEHGRVLPLTGCDTNGRGLCWENYLIWGEGSRIYPWPVLTLYSRFASFKERNSWLLFGHEPQIWYTNSLFQMRVPEVVTRAALALFSTSGQIIVNRVVTSLHHRWWGNGAVEYRRLPRAESESAPNESRHARDAESECEECGGGPCHYPLCLTAQCGRYKEETMVDLGCSAPHSQKGQTSSKHLLCTDCFEGLTRASALQPCRHCQQYHPSLLNRDYYQIDPEEASRDTPSAPMCPSCRSRFDSRAGNIRQFLHDECGALWQRVKWLFSDSLPATGATEKTVEHCH